MSPPQPTNHPLHQRPPIPLGSLPTPPTPPSHRNSWPSHAESPRSHDGRPQPTRKRNVEELLDEYDDGSDKHERNTKTPRRDSRDSGYGRRDSRDCDGDRESEYRLRRDSWRGKDWESWKPGDTDTTSGARRGSTPRRDWDRCDEDRRDSMEDDSWRPKKAEGRSLMERIEQPADLTKRQVAAMERSNETGNNFAIQNLIVDRIYTTFGNKIEPIRAGKRGVDNRFIYNFRGRAAILETTKMNEWPRDSVQEWLRTGEFQIWRNHGGGLSSGKHAPETYNDSSKSGSTSLDGVPKLISWHVWQTYNVDVRSERIDRYGVGDLFEYEFHGKSQILKKLPMEQWRYIGIRNWLQNGTLEVVPIKRRSSESDVRPTSSKTETSTAWASPKQSRIDTHRDTPRSPTTKQSTAIPPPPQWADDEEARAKIQKIITDHIFRKYKVLPSPSSVSIHNIGSEFECVYTGQAKRLPIKRMAKWLPEQVEKYLKSGELSIVRTGSGGAANKGADQSDENRKKDAVSEKPKPSSPPPNRKLLSSERGSVSDRPANAKAKEDGSLSTSPKRQPIKKPTTVIDLTDSDDEDTPSKPEDDQPPVSLPNMDRKPSLKNGDRVAREEEPGSPMDLSMSPVGTPKLRPSPPTTASLLPSVSFRTGTRGRKQEESVDVDMDDGGKDDNEVDRMEVDLPMQNETKPSTDNTSSNDNFSTATPLANPDQPPAITTVSDPSRDEELWGATPLHELPAGQGHGKIPCTPWLGDADALSPPPPPPPPPQQRQSSQPPLPSRSSSISQTLRTPPETPLSPRSTGPAPIQAPNILAPPQVTKLPELPVSSQTHLKPVKKPIDEKPLSSPRPDTPSSIIKEEPVSEAKKFEPDVRKAESKPEKSRPDVKPVEEEKKKKQEPTTGEDRKDAWARHMEMLRLRRQKVREELEKEGLLPFGE